MKCRILMMLVCMITCMANMEAKYVEIEDENEGYVFCIYTDRPDYGCIGRVYPRQRDRLLKSYEIRLPESVSYDGQEYLITELFSYAFRGGYPEEFSAEVITLHDNFETVDVFNFSKMSKIKEVNIGASMKQIYLSFNDLPSLERLNIAGSTWGKDLRIWESFNRCGIESARLPEEKRVRLENSFNELPNLSEIDLQGVQLVSGSICDNPLLEEVVIEPEIIDIRDGSFCNLASLKRIIFKNRRSLPIWCSADCFRDNPLLTDVFVEDLNGFAITGWDDEPYEFLSKLTLYVPGGTEMSYEDSRVWSKFGKIVQYSGPAGAEVATADGGELKCRANGSGIEVTAPQGAMINVTAIDGRTMTQVASAGEPVLVELPAGIYVVTSAGQSMKVCVR